MRRKKPTSMSETANPCKCRWLERMSSEPDEPISFDDASGEYHITKPRGGYLVIYHCPFCGGAAPLSRRHELFADISDAEVERLRRVTARVKTVQQAIKVLGKPDHDAAQGLTVHTPAKGRRRPRVVSYRVLTFTRLSDTADVEVVDCGTNGIRVSFQGKYLGRRPGRRTSG